jgi:hypothetical protein
MSALFEARATEERVLHLLNCSFAQKGECFLHDFEALGCKIDVRALVLQNDLRLLCGREMPF